MSEDAPPCADCKKSASYYSVMFSPSKAMYRGKPTKVLETTRRDWCEEHAKKHEAKGDFGDGSVFRIIRQ